MKKTKIWPLSVLVIIVSVLSIVVIENGAKALWVQPTTLPGTTSLTNNIVFTPLSQNLDLGSSQIIKGGTDFYINPDGLTGMKISGSGLGADISSPVVGASISGTNVGASLTGTTAALFHGQICFNDPSVPSNCISSWPSAGTSYWTLAGNDISNNNSGNVNIGSLCLSGVCRTDWPAAGATYWTLNGNNISNNNSGNVGIGTSNPNRKLHVADSANNAEIDLQTGSNNYWAIYHDSATEDLRFWNSDSTSGDQNVLYLTHSGNVGIGGAPQTARLNVLTNTDYIFAINGESTAALGLGVNGKGWIGLAAQGVGSNSVAMVAVAAAGAGITGARAASFSGDIYADSNMAISTTPSSSYKLRAVASGTSGSATAIRGDSVTGYGVYGYASDPTSGTGVYGRGMTGVKGVALTGGMAGSFDGSVEINNAGVLNVSGLVTSAGGFRSVGVNGYFYLTSVSAPTITCVDNTNRGAIYFDQTNRLYVCTGAGGWRYTTLN
ncbi:MAG: hypothetical protein WC465_02830 [Patescibacteria group bacterium]